MSQMKKCLICNQRTARRLEPYGYLPCKTCQKLKAGRAVSYEITTEEIKSDRRKFHDDILQPFRDGTLSKEYMVKYPDRVKQMIKEGHVKDSEVRNAKPVWDMDYYKDI